MLNIQDVKQIADDYNKKKAIESKLLLQETIAKQGQILIKEIETKIIATAEKGEYQIEIEIDSELVDYIQDQLDGFDMETHRGDYGEMILDICWGG